MSLGHRQIELTNHRLTMESKEGSKRSAKEREHNHPKGVLSTKWVKCPWQRIIKLGTKFKAPILGISWKTSLDIRAGLFGTHTVRKVQSERPTFACWGWQRRWGGRRAGGKMGKSEDLVNRVLKMFTLTVALWITCIRIPREAGFRNRYPANNVCTYE
jgi:hypothetical protein